MVPGIHVFRSRHLALDVDGRDKPGHDDHRAAPKCPSKRLLGPMPTNDFPMVDVLRLRPLDGYRLWLRFTDGSEGVRDLSDVIAKDGVMVEPLKSKEYFDRVFVELGAPTWPSGFDLDPINLYMQLRDAGALSSVA
jgi:Protein of unknown function (DUF2442)